MDEPLVFYPDCDLITDTQEYQSCVECYRYETCKNAWEKEVKPNKKLIEMDLSLPKHIGLKTRFLIWWSNLIDDFSTLKRKTVKPNNRNKMVV